MGFVTATILIISISISFVLIYLPGLHDFALQIQDEQISRGRESVLELLKESEETVAEEALVEDELKGHQIRLTLPANVSAKSVSIDSSPVDKRISIAIDGIGKNYFEEYPIVGNSDNIAEITYASENMTGVIEITLDDVFELSMETQDEYVYFDFVDPHEIYDYIVVVDAGHGGSVPGATKRGVSEKDIDLDIVLQLQKIFERSDKNIGVYYTRTTDVNPTFAARVGLANDAEADLFLSIHNNSTASGRMSSINGTEVMYKAADKSGESKLLSTILLTHLLEDLGTKSKGTVVGDDIYIIRESKAPVALVEVGFMTNQAELENLCDEDYQMNAAQAMYDGIIEYLYQE